MDISSKVLFNVLSIVMQEDVLQILESLLRRANTNRVSKNQAMSATRKVFTSRQQTRHHCETSPCEAEIVGASNRERHGRLPKRVGASGLIHVEAAVGPYTVVSTYSRTVSSSG